MFVNVSLYMTYDAKAFINFKSFVIRLLRQVSSINRICLSMDNSVREKHLRAIENALIDVNLKHISYESYEAWERFHKRLNVVQPSVSSLE